MYGREEASVIQFYTLLGKFTNLRMLTLQLYYFQGITTELIIDNLKNLQKLSFLSISIEEIQDCYEGNYFMFQKSLVTSIIKEIPRLDKLYVRENLRFFLYSLSSSVKDARKRPCLIISKNSILGIEELTKFKDGTPHLDFDN